MIPQQLDPQFVSSLQTAVAAQLPEYLPKQRWFRSKARRIASARLTDCVPVPLSQSVALIALSAVEFTKGPAETYVLPLVALPRNRAWPQESVVLRLPGSDYASGQLLIDALADHEFLMAILSAIMKSASFAGKNGSVVAAPEPSFGESSAQSFPSLQPRLLKGEQSNSSISYGDKFILKFFRRLEDGILPDLEISRFLTSTAHFGNVPQLCGSLAYESHEPATMTLGMLQCFVPNRGDAWRWTVESLAELFVSPNHPTGVAGPGSAHSPALSVQSRSSVSAASGRLASQLELIGLLGKRTAELHLALSSSGIDPDFAPEPFTPEVREEMEAAFHDLAVQNFETLRGKLPELPRDVADLAKQVLAMEDDALLLLRSIVEKEISSIRTRIHGDYHLGQVLFTGSDFFIIDFEGEPARPLSERRNKRSPLQDVAGMLRSFHYAARAATNAAKERLPRIQNAEAQIVPLASEWQALAAREFLGSYHGTAGDAKFLPADPGEFDALLRAFLLDKAVYELGYELNNRPAWLATPLEGIRDILATEKSHP